MQPYLKLPKVIENNEKKTKEVIARLLPAQIEDYYPGFYEGTVVVMKSGNSFFTPISAEEFDSAMMMYDEFIKANAGKFGFLELKVKQKPKLHVSG